MLNDLLYHPKIFSYKPTSRENKESGNSGLANELENFVPGRKYLVTPNSSDEAFQKLVIIIKKCKASIEEESDARGVGFEGLNLDSRVVPFLTTFSHKGKLPPTMKILSLKYDTQLARGANRPHPLTPSVTMILAKTFMYGHPRLPVATDSIRTIFCCTSTVPVAFCIQSGNWLLGIHIPWVSTDQ
jgi:hypothetical protein